MVHDFEGMALLKRQPRLNLPPAHKVTTRTYYYGSPHEDWWIDIHLTDGGYLCWSVHNYPPFAHVLDDIENASAKGFVSFENGIPTFRGPTADQARVEYYAKQLKEAQDQLLA